MNVIMTNNTVKDLVAYNIPSDGTTQEVKPGESHVIGEYSQEHNKFYMAMVITGFSMSIVNQEEEEEVKESKKKILLETPIKEDKKNSKEDNKEEPKTSKAKSDKK